MIVLQMYKCNIDTQCSLVSQLNVYIQMFNFFRYSMYCFLQISLRLEIYYCVSQGLKV